MKLSLIVSIQWCPGSPNHFGIGYGPDLLHDLPDDKKNFRTVTENKVVIMGRKTWEAIPEKFRPLRDRTNIVISTTMEQFADTTKTVVYRSLEEALELCATTCDEVFIMGGSRLYEEALPKADRIYLTLVAGNKPANIFFPRINFEEAFPKVVETKNLVDEKTQTPWTYMVADKD